MDEKLNLQNLIALLAESHGMSKRNAESFVKEFFLLIEEALEKDKYVKIKGLGAFKLIEVDSRESVNVNTGERFEIQGHTKISFTPDATLRDVINKPFSHFDTVVLNDDITLENTPLENGFADDLDDNEGIDTDPDSPKVEEEVVIQPQSPAIKEEQVNRLKEEAVGSDIIYMEARGDENKPEPTTELASESIRGQEQSATEKQEASPKIEPVTPIKPAVETIQAKKSQYVIDDQDGESDSAQYEYGGHRDSSAMKYFISIIVLVVLLCGGAIAFMYYPEISDDFMSKPAPKNIAKPVANKAPVKKTAQLDSMGSERGDSITRKVSEVSSKPPVVKERTVVLRKQEPALKAENKPVTSHVENNKVTGSEKSVNAKPSTLDPSQYKIAGTKTTYTIQRDESLTKVSLQFYGSKNLWTYIVKYNRDIIKDPDHVPYGTKIKIPELVQK